MVCSRINSRLAGKMEETAAREKYWRKEAKKEKKEIEQAKNRSVDTHSYCQISGGRQGCLRHQAC
jgi:hypothetical protein